jgi:hypothetical protein
VLSLSSTGGKIRKASYHNDTPWPAYLECSDRPFMEFLIPTLHPLIPEEKVTALVEGILELQGVEAVIYSEKGLYARSPSLRLEPKYDPRDAPPYGGEDDRLHWFRSTAKGKIARRVFRIAHSAPALITAPWWLCLWHDVATVFDLPRQENTQTRFDRDDYRSISAIMNMRPLNISMWFAEWHPENNHRNIQDTLGRLCAKVGMKPVFAGDVCNGEDD